MSLEQAIALHQQGRLAEAEILYRQELTQRPRQAAVHYQLGVLCMQQGRFAEAVTFLEDVLRLRQDEPSALINLGMALRHLGRPSEALAPLERAAAAMPDQAEVQYQQAAALHELGRAAAAEPMVARALALQPDHARGGFLQGVVLTDLGRPEEAAASYDRLLARHPGHVEALSNRGLLAWSARDPDGALAFLNRALALKPDHAPALTNRALVLGNTGKPAAALADYEKLLTLNPGNADTWNQRGVMLRALGRDAEALDSFDHAVGLDPDFGPALLNRGYLRWLVEERHADAMADLTRALALAPEQAWLEGELFYLKMQGADWNGFAEGRAALAAKVAAGRKVVQPFIFQAVNAEPALLQQCSRIFAANELSVPPRPAPPPARDQGRIRVGYLSADFREQATAYLMAGVYEAHDRTQFEITAFDNGHDDASPMRARLLRSFDRFVSIADLSDAEAAAAVRAADIDILVSLNGYFGKPRLAVFARRPAPVQVNYLGFPATLGAPYIDYIIADRVVIPQEERRFYDEAVVWLPGSYQANDRQRPRPAPSSRPQHGLPEDKFVFCNFNQGYKLAPETFALWMRLLRAAPDSVLWLLHDRDVAVANLRREAERAGVAAERLVFAPLTPLQPHLSRLALADLFLDSLPYNAHTTGSDALWAGVPLITCRGTAFPGRVAASLLAAAGLPELITESPEAYEALALALAADRERLAALRARLAQNRESCALFDTAGFTLGLEAAYRTMIARSRAGLAPEAFAVP